MNANQEELTTQSAKGSDKLQFKHLQSTNNSSQFHKNFQEESAIDTILCNLVKQI